MLHSLLNGEFKKFKPEGMLFNQSDYALNLFVDITILLIRKNLTYAFGTE